MCKTQRPDVSAVGPKLDRLSGVKPGLSSKIAELIKPDVTPTRANGCGCGSCSLCCRVLDIAELNKPAHTWCRHCRPGKGGCSIYADRPPVCRRFACVWLLDANCPEHWFPKRARMVICETAQRGERTITINVDQRYPERWREEPYFSDIRQLALSGLKQSDGGRFATWVVVGARSWLILPHREIELSVGDCGVFVSVGLDKFEWLKTRSRADAEQLVAMKEALAAEARCTSAAVVELEMMLRKLPATGEPEKSPTIDRSPSS